MSLLQSLRSWMLPLKQIDEALPTNGLIYEIGCGWGTLSAYMAITSPERRLIAIDVDKNKLDAAKKSYLTENLHFVYGDAMNFNYQPFAGIIFSDFLHHINYEQQEKLLKIISNKIKKTGIVVIKEIDNADGIRRFLSRLWDFLLYPKDNIFYRDKKDLSALLLRFGYKVKIQREVPWFPGSTYLFVCSKK